MRVLILVLALAAASPALAADKPAKPAAAKPATSGAAYDARDPAALVTLLAGMDAQASVISGDKNIVVLDIVTPGGKFGAQFVDCDAKGKACQALAFSTAFERRGPTLAQINVFNRTQVACRGYLTDDGRSNVMYAVMLTSRLNAADMKQHLGVWQSCLTTFGKFNRDPQAYVVGG